MYELRWWRHDFVVIFFVEYKKNFPTKDYHYLLRHNFLTHMKHSCFHYFSEVGLQPAHKQLKIHLHLNFVLKWIRNYTQWIALDYIYIWLPQYLLEKRFRYIFEYSFKYPHKFQDGIKRGFLVNLCQFTKASLFCHPETVLALEKSTWAVLIVQGTRRGMTPVLDNIVSIHKYPSKWTPLERNLNQLCAYKDHVKQSNSIENVKNKTHFPRDLWCIMSPIPVP